ncbi:hypothetical protein T492DRAFT_138252 [Pavlovales sp. CCMP2436]|nr:hypothetical protein T492DRAFT_138252 [Pavlovales sp. CCMP2436]
MASCSYSTSLDYLFLILLTSTIADNQLNVNANSLAFPAEGQPFRCGHCCSYCESCRCSLRQQTSAHALGRWCADCAPNATRGQCCAVCMRVYDADSADSQMVFCGSCAAWVHVACDGIESKTYEQLASDELGYLCPGCRNGVLGVVLQQQRALQRVITKVLFNNSFFNLPRLAARRRTGMTWEDQRIGHLMCYLTHRVVSPPRSCRRNTKQKKRKNISGNNNNRLLN